MASGKHDFARARAVIKEGSGIVRYNSVPLDKVMPELVKLKIMEPLMIAGDLAGKVDVNIKTNGGGIMGQAMAARLAIARALIKYSKSQKLRQAFIEYDRKILVADVRRKETRKPGPSKARAGAQKSKR